MYCEPIKNDSTLLDFAEAFRVLGNVQLPFEYYKSSRAIGCFDDSGELIGGWLTKLTPPYRALGLIPEEAKANNAFCERVSPSEILELNGVWLDPSITSTKRSFWFWRRVLGDVLCQRRKYIIFGYPKAKQGLGRFYARLAPVTIFDGPIHHGIEAHIAYLTPAKIILFFITQAPWLVARHFNLLSRGIAQSEKALPQNASAGVAAGR